LSFIVIPYGIDKFFILLYVLSNLVIIPVMLDLIIFKNLCLKKAGWYGLAYAITSIIIGGIVFFNITSTQSLLFIPYTLLFLMILCFFYDVKMCGLSFVRKLKEKKKRSVTGLFIRYLLYVVSLSAFIFFSTIAVHELGHALTAKAYGCEHSKAVVFDIHDYPHTEMVCENKTEMTDIMITIAGLAITFVLGTAFLLTGGEFATRLAYLIYGFSLFLSFNDIKELGFSQNSIFIIMFFAVLIIVVALVMISIKYLNEQYYDCKGKDLESRGSEEEKNGKKKKS